MPGEPPADRLEATIDENESESGYHWRHGHRKVDEGGQEPLSGNVVTDDEDGGRHAEHRVAHDREERHLEGDPEGVDGVGLAERLPDGARTVCEGAPEDEADRDDEHERQIGDGHEP